MWKVVRWPSRLYNGIVPFFDYPVAILPLYVRAMEHWVAVAVINPGSIFIPFEELDVNTYGRLCLFSEPP